MIVTWLKAKRLELGLSLSELEKITGLDYTYLSKVERYIQKPKHDALQKYLNVLGISLKEYEQAFEEKRQALVRTVIEV